jgi:Protein of unknown function (DUF1588)/Protein of unknown function (DUF1592)/Protein of unknown function (DUF1595)/Protein of unknown function (DUF1585)/Protein of unknown function (DUF1587)
MAVVTSKFVSRGGLFASRTSWVRVGIGCLLASVVAGCDGQHGAAGPTTGSGGSGPGTGGGAGSGQTGGAGVNPASCNGTVSVAPTPLRRFTHAEFDHAVRALLGTSLAPARDFPPDSPGGGFASNRGEAVSQLGVEKLMLAAEALAAEAVTRLSTLVPCSVATPNATCARQFYTDLARRAYRRTPDAGELDELGQLYSWGETNGGFALGIQVVIERVLQSPHFFYHVERTGAPLNANVAPLTGQSVADRLAAFIWHSLPDTALLDAADHGELDSAAGIEAQAERMLADAKGRDGVVEFFNQYLDIGKLDITEKSSTTYPAYSAAVRTEMWNETTSFVDFVVRQGDGRLETLLTSPLAMPSPGLAPLYKLAPGAAFTAMDPLVRSGILTHPSVLAVHAHSDQSSPVRRGAFIRARVLCAPLPDPPPNVNANPPVVNPGATTRQRFEQHRANPSCAVCHSLIDPVGFAFEHYDGMGLYRTTDGTLPLDTTGTLTGTQDIDGPFQDGIELTKRFATSQQVRDCMATQWLRYAVRRDETDADACSQQQVATAFRASGDMKQLVRAVVQSDAFRYKTKAAP